MTDRGWNLYAIRYPQVGESCEPCEWRITEGTNGEGPGHTVCVVTSCRADVDEIIAAHNKALT